jgi:hypothetical protein
MRLDAAQYSELDPDLIQPLGGIAFLLRVPRITVREPGARAGKGFLLRLAAA